VEWSATPLVLHGYVGTGIDQQLDHVRAVEVGYPMQHRAAVGTDVVHRSTLL
jgi:hypothetical protein